MNLVLTPDEIVIEGDTDGDSAMTIKGLVGLADYVKKQVKKKIGPKFDSLIKDANQKVR